MREIWQFLMVLLAGVIFACALVYWMVRGEAVDKQMSVAQVLLSPDTIETLSNRAIAGGKDRPPEYLIESIKFTHLDDATKKWATERVDIGPYRAFYKEIERDRGVIDPPEALLQSFQSAQTSKLALYMKYFAPLVQEGKVEQFQEVEFNSEGSGYRINLHVDTGAMQWVYFSHPRVLQLAEEKLLGK